MSFEPEKFFIGLIDFFSILMPGALLTYLGKDWAAVKLGLTGGYPLANAEAYVVFLFASYLIGHFVFLVSSLLDDYVYDPVRAWTEWGQISRRLAKGEALSANWKRRLANSKWLFDSNADAAVMEAQRIKARSLDALKAADAINAFQWCKARLTGNSREGLLAVQRFEADSKFFRSFVVVLTILTVYYALLFKWRAVVCLAAILPAMWRYIDQRYKATQQAYWFVITMEATKPDPVLYVPQICGLIHAGGVVYRGGGPGTEFLLVEASCDRSQWVLPKGHIEAGESLRVTAVREVQEESGHWARVVGWLGDRPLKGDTGEPTVRWFLMELVEEAEKPNDEDRQFVWLGLEDAKRKATFPETQELLGAAAGHLQGTIGG